MPLNFSIKPFILINRKMKHIALSSHTSFELQRAVLGLEAFNLDIQDAADAFGQTALEDDKSDSAGVMSKMRDRAIAVYEWIKEFCKKIAKRVTDAAKYVRDKFTSLFSTIAARSKSIMRGYANLMVSDNKKKIAEYLNNHSVREERMAMRLFITSEGVKVVSDIMDALHVNGKFLISLNARVREYLNAKDVEAVKALTGKILQENAELQHIAAICKEVKAKFDTDAPIEPVDFDKLRMEDLYKCISNVKNNYIDRVDVVCSNYSAVSNTFVAIADKLSIKAKGAGPEAEVAAAAVLGINDTITAIKWLATDTHWSNVLVGLGVAGLLNRITDAAESISKKEEK